MGTGDTFINWYRDRQIPREQLRDNLQGWLRELILDHIARVWNESGLFDNIDIIGEIDAVTFRDHTGDDPGDLGYTPPQGLDIYGHEVILPESLCESIPFENELGATYYWGMKYVEPPYRAPTPGDPDPIIANPRPPKAWEYEWLEEGVGELETPDSVADDGAKLTLVVDSVFEAGVDHSGRSVIIYLVDPVSGIKTVAFRTLTSQYDGVNNYVEIPYDLAAENYPLGQGTNAQSNPISTVATDYMAYVPGPTWRRNTNLANETEYIYFGSVVGGGAGNLPGAIVDEPDQIILDLQHDFTLDGGYDGPLGSGGGRSVLVDNGSVLLRVTDETDDCGSPRVRAAMQVRTEAETQRVFPYMAETYKGAAGLGGNLSSFVELAELDGAELGGSGWSQTQVVTAALGVAAITLANEPGADYNMLVGSPYEIFIRLTFEAAFDPTYGGLYRVVTVLDPGPPPVVLLERVGAPTVAFPAGGSGTPTAEFFEVPVGVNLDVGEMFGLGVGTTPPVGFYARSGDFTDDYRFRHGVLYNGPLEGSCLVGVRYLTEMIGTNYPWINVRNRGEYASHLQFSDIDTYALIHHTRTMGDDDAVSAFAYDAKPTHYGLRVHRRIGVDAHDWWICKADRAADDGGPYLQTHAKLVAGPHVARQHKDTLLPDFFADRDGIDLLPWAPVGLPLGWNFPWLGAVVGEDGTDFSGVRVYQRSDATEPLGRMDYVFQRRDNVRHDHRTLTEWGTCVQAGAFSLGNEFEIREEDEGEDHRISFWRIRWPSILAPYETLRWNWNEEAAPAPGFRKNVLHLAVPGNRIHDGVTGGTFETHTSVEVYIGDPFNDWCERWIQNTVPLGDAAGDPYDFPYWLNLLHGAAASRFWLMGTLRSGGDKFCLADSGDLMIAGNYLRYGTHYCVVQGMEFVPQFDAAGATTILKHVAVGPPAEPADPTFVEGYAYPRAAGAVSLYAWHAADLPDGAYLDEIQLWSYRPLVADDVTLTLFRVSRTSGAREELFTVQPISGGGLGRPALPATSGVLVAGGRVVDLSAYTYYFRAQMNSAIGPVTDTRFYTAAVKYRG